MAQGADPAQWLQTLFSISACFLFPLILRVEPRALCVLGKYLHWATSPALFILRQLLRIWGLKLVLHFSQYFSSPSASRYGLFSSWEFRSSVRIRLGMLLKTKQGSAAEMVQQVKVLVTKPDDLNLTPRTQVVKEVNWPPATILWVHRYTRECLCTHVHTNRNLIIECNFFN